MNKQNQMIEIELTPLNALTSPRFLTKFERARVIGIRAQQISNGAPSTLHITEVRSSIEIAEEELKEKKMPLIIQRKFPDGFVENVDVNQLL